MRLSPAWAWSAPQQVWALGTLTVQPQRSSRRTASRLTAGNITSMTQVLKKATRARGGPGGWKTRPSLRRSIRAPAGSAAATHSSRRAARGTSGGVIANPCTANAGSSRCPTRERMKAENGGLWPSRRRSATACKRLR